MTTDVAIVLVDTHAGAGPVNLNACGRESVLPTNPALFPTHFLKATLPKIGGEVVTFRRA